jgi:hypothetical protein
MADIIELNPVIDDNQEDINNNAEVVSINKEEEVVFETLVHFTLQEGFHLRDKSGTHIYKLGGIIQNMIMQLIQLFVK